MIVSAIVATVAVGKLFLVGGGDAPDEIPKRFIKEIGGPNSLIVVIPQMREEPKNGAPSVEWLTANGAQRVVLLGATNPTDDDRKAAEEILKQARGIWMPGGDQELFMQRWGVPWIRKQFQAALKRGVCFYGTSAGAMLMSETMILGPGEEENSTRWNPGAGLTQYTIDSHVRERDRLPRMKYTMEKAGLRQMIGLSEGEWVILQGDKIIEIHGNPVVIEKSKD